MKRILIASALTASLFSTAHAATEAEIAQIRSFAPNVNIQELSDTEVSQAMNIISSSESRSSKIGQINALFGVDSNTANAATPEEAERAIIERYAPKVDFSTVTNAQVATAMTIINSGMSEDDVQSRVQQVLDVNSPTISTLNTATESEQAILQRYIPEIEVEKLTEQELNTALAIVYGGGGEGDIQSRLEAFVN